ncbi:MAG TPA: DUF2934 domain-containing protein [Burkholderiales bacterium]|nr:DUF2934 domain-containing protein [Burkholderiales bacterium]
MKSKKTSSRKPHHAKAVARKTNRLVKPGKSANRTIRAEPSRTAEINPSELYNWIAVAAYYRAEQRDFVPGSELRDWLEAEAEILRWLND